MASAATETATKLALSFHELHIDLQSGADEDSTISRMLRLAIDAVPRCSCATLISRVKNSAPKTIGYTSPSGLQVEDLQRAVACGPALDAVCGSGFVVTADMTDDVRWPQLSAGVREASPIRSALAFRVAEESGGLALTMYSTETSAFPVDVLEIGALFAAHARSLMSHFAAVRKSTNLAEALATSRMIGSAIGIVMSARRSTSEQAFDLLRAASQRKHVKLRDLAEEVIRTGALPDGCCPPKPRLVAESMAQVAASRQLHNSA